VATHRLTGSFCFRPYTARAARGVSPSPAHRRLVVHARRRNRSRGSTAPQTGSTYAVILAGEGITQLLFWCCADRLAAVPPLKPPPSAGPWALSGRRAWTARSSRAHARAIRVAFHAATVVGTDEEVLAVAPSLRTLLMRGPGRGWPARLRCHVRQDPGTAPGQHRLANRAHLARTGLLNHAVCPLRAIPEYPQRDSYLCAFACSSPASRAARSLRG
jgi:hypothetical protein